MPTRLIAAALALAPLHALVLAAPAPATAAPIADPIVWAHRGASYFSRENTVEAFRLAGDLGADGFELDLVLTKDGRLAVFHDNALEDLTNVEAVFGPSRARTGADGRPSWRVADFTMAELKTLVVDGDRGPGDVIRDPARNPYAVDAAYAFRIPTYGEALDVLNDYPDLRVLTEVKDNFGEFADRDAATARAQVVAGLEAALSARGYGGADGPVVVQSFSPVFMQEIDAAFEKAGLTVSLVQLDGDFTLIPRRLGALAPDTPPDGPAILTTQDLSDHYAALFGDLDGLAQNLNMLPVDGAPFYGQINPLGVDAVAAAQAAGLDYYVWTLILPPGMDVDAYHAWAFDPAAPIDFGAQYAQAIALGVDGIITDNPDIARAVLAPATPIPLPAAGWLLLAGMGALAAARRRR